MSKVRSSKGEIVDFDLLKIKAQMTAAPKTVDVKAREDFIDKKLQRRLRRLKHDVNVSQVADVKVEPDAPAVGPDEEPKE